MGLTRKNLNARIAESGSCFHQKARNGKEAEIYVVQTPTYGDEFWYLIILATKVPERVAAVLYVDSDINAADIIHEVHNQAANDPHYLYLLLELFEDHSKRTRAIYDSVISIINDIDKFLGKKLNTDNGTAVSNGARTLDTARELSEKTHQLHRVRANLVRLRRRRDFERKITDALSNRGDGWSELSERTAIYTSLASNHDADLEDLPRRIESQSSVITSLIAQQDAQLQYRLTLSTVEDSKGMVTLSVITIFFLPGAFVATLFSTNMFDFATPDQEVGIYFGIVIPLTVILFYVWKLWLGSHPVVPVDLESGGGPRRKKKNQ
jgi:Mg2+ and Co2+ transporter CorA